MQRHNIKRGDRQKSLHEKKKNKSKPTVTPGTQRLRITIDDHPSSTPFLDAHRGTMTAFVCSHAKALAAFGPEKRSRTVEFSTSCRLASMYGSATRDNSLCEAAYKSGDTWLIDTKHDDFKHWLTTHWQQARVKGKKREFGIDSLQAIEQRNNATIAALTLKRVSILLSEPHQLRF